MPEKFVWLIVFSGITNLMGYLMPIPVQTNMLNIYDL